jgi:exopolyphosphatase/pppGpp-phosphohydrolase
MGCVVKEKPGAIRAFSLSIDEGMRYRVSAGMRLSNNVTNRSPVIPTAAMIASAMSAAMRPYSMAVAARRLRTSLLKKVMSFRSPEETRRAVAQPVEIGAICRKLLRN